MWPSHKIKSQIQLSNFFFFSSEHGDVHTACVVLHLFASKLVPSSETIVVILQLLFTVLYDLYLISDPENTTALTPQYNGHTNKAERSHKIKQMFMLIFFLKIKQFPNNVATQL